MPCKLTLQLNATWLVFGSVQIFFAHSIVFLNSLREPDSVRRGVVGFNATVADVKGGHL